MIGYKVVQNDGGKLYSYIRWRDLRKGVRNNMFGSKKRRQLEREWAKDDRLRADRPRRVANMELWDAHVQHQLALASAQKGGPLEWEESCKIVTALSQKQHEADAAGAGDDRPGAGYLGDSAPPQTKTPTD